MISINDQIAEPEWTAFVFVSGVEVRLDDVEFLNVEEDISGRDLVTFIYEGKTLTSFVTGRWA